MTTSGPEHVAVIGAGIVGTCAALALLADGRRITLIDPAPPGGPQAASFGNGAFISPASIIPMSFPGLWRQVPRLLADPAGPLTIRWRSLPALTPWLIRFLLSGATPARVRRTAGILNGLLGDAPGRHAAIALGIGQPGMIRHDGLIYAYPTRADFEAEALSWTIRRENGLDWQELDGGALHQLEPALGPSYRFAAYLPSGAWCTDPGGYVAALAQAAVAGGANRRHARATGFEVMAGKLTAVQTDHGPIACDAALVAAGIASGALARAAGDRVPLVSERGYHVELPGATGGPARPIMPADGKMANSPCATGLRAAGQVELAGTGDAPDWRRAEILLDNMRRAYPALRFDAALLRRWLGHRPSTPDGLPVIGPASGVGGVHYAFGHGHVGLAAAPMTAAIAAAQLAGRPAPIDAAPFAAARFAGRMFRAANR
ncbi:NAD(P)/FAD-dependent oxidoreductase [Paracoccus xiamenensis]|uniref:NAD(P)/FAD-dependent oxidoreductase n=1 Tax=Paracoccus xiamenensis TaxID=2714901 RepID=UPI00140A6E57|nr:FAD-binding oxidoreductase [Paracoccus xiamenensis]NHF71777.1 FAD-binding oxidoreductase [Paracoccus xiamenensis]